jgi:tetratricopeptide (TPR) repeat protein
MKTKVLLMTAVLVAFVVVVAVGCAPTMDEEIQKEQAEITQPPKELSPESKLRLEGFLRRGQESMNEGNYSTAEGYFRWALEIDPDNIIAKAGFDQAIEMQRREKEQEQIARYKQFEDELSDKIIAENKVERAIQLYPTAIQQGNKELIDAAIELLTNATKLDPTSEKAWYHLGVILSILQGNDKEGTPEAQTYLNRGIAAFNRCLAINPDNFDCRFGLGSAFLDAGKCASALEEFNKCEKMAPIPKVYDAIAKGWDCMAAGNSKNADEYRNKAREAQSR